MGNRSNQAAFVARSNIKKAGQKPKWQGKRPFLAPPQPQQGQSSQGGWQNVQKKQWKRPFTPYQKPNYQNSTQGPSQGQKGPNWAKNRQNRENKKLASALRKDDDSPMKANIPQFTNMAIDMKKEEEMIDLSPKNFPKLGNHTIKSSCEDYSL